MTTRDRKVDYDSFDEGEESRKDQELDEEDRAYFPLEESKPPHY